MGVTLVFARESKTPYDMQNKLKFVVILMVEISYHNIKDGKVRREWTVFRCSLFGGQE